MGKVGKIAIGCVLFLFLAGVALIAGLGGLAWWGKGKLESKLQEVQKDESRIDDAHKRADANTFVEPADGVIDEDRLVKFLEVRKRVFGVYEQHKAEFEALKDKKQGDIGDLRTAYNVLTEARTTQAEALADSGMSTTEYQYLVGQVYKSMWATEVAKSTGGKSVSEATGSAFDTMAEAMKASGSTSPETQKAIAQMKAQAAQTQESAKQLDVPQANIDLFRKHEAEIKRYAMGGLELLGL